MRQLTFALFISLVICSAALTAHAQENKTPEQKSGHPLLYAACVKAARESVFTPTKLEGEAVKVTGVIQYNFVAQ